MFWPISSSGSRLHPSHPFFRFFSRQIRPTWSARTPHTHRGRCHVACRTVLIWQWDRSPLGDFWFRSSFRTRTRRRLKGSSTGGKGRRFGPSYPKRKRNGRRTWNPSKEFLLCRGWKRIVIRADKAGRTISNGWKKAKRIASVARRRPRMCPMHESVRPLHAPIRIQAQPPRDRSSMRSNNCTLPVPNHLVAVLNLSSMEHDLMRKYHETKEQRRMENMVSFVTSSWRECYDVAFSQL